MMTETENIKHLMDAVGVSADDTGCDGGLTVVGKEELYALLEALDIHFEEEDMTPMSLIDAHDSIIEAIDRAKLSILRGMHSGDKVAKILVNLVETMHEVCPVPHWVCSCCGDFHDPELFKDQDPGQITCPQCGGSMFYDDPEALIMETEAFKEADAYVLRIDAIKKSKKDKDEQ